MSDYVKRQKHSVLDIFVPLVDRRTSYFILVNLRFCADAKHQFPVSAEFLCERFGWLDERRDFLGKTSLEVMREWERDAGFNIDLSEVYPHLQSPGLVVERCR